MLQHMKLNHRFWAKTMVTTRYIHNQIFTKTISNMTLGKVWCGHKLSISHLCVFGLLHLLMCQIRKQGQSWIPKVSNAYSLVIVKRLRGINCTTL
jgi:hypothetical protein